MKFSITIPAYKKRYLAEAVESVIRQTYNDFELIIVDDCSPEELYSIVQSFSDSRIRYYRNQRNYGAVDVVDNWNKCIEYAKGEYIICMGDDDRLKPCCLEELAKLIKKYPDCHVFHSLTDIIDEQGNVCKKLEKRPEYESAFNMLLKRLQGRSQYIGDFCYSVEKLRESGGFFPLPLAWGSDDITAVRAAIKKGIANTQTECFEYRVNSSSISEDNTNDIIKIEALKKSECWYLSSLNEITHGDENNNNLLRGVLRDRFSKLYSQHAFNTMRTNCEN